MNTLVKDDWNAGSNKWFEENASESIIDKTIQDPMWVFPSPVRNMLNCAFNSLEGKRILVPSSGNNVAVFAFHLLGAKVTSSDIAENQLKNAKRIADSHGWDIEFICDDSMRLFNIKENEYDLVYTSNGVHVWIYDLPGMYQSFNRVLKRDGKYIMFEVHPFNRPFTADAENLFKIKSVKPYEAVGPLGEIPTYHWRVQDFANSMIGAGFSIQQMVEFYSEKDVHDCWWYTTSEEAEADGNKLANWELNPWAALPQWIGFTAEKTC